LKNSYPYLDITKPRITFLVLLSTAVGFFAGIADWNSDPSFRIASSLPTYIESHGGIAKFWQSFLFLLLGTGLASAAGSVFNNILDRDMDALMDRTKKRAMPRKKIKVKDAAFYAYFLLFSGVLILYYYCNFISAVLVFLAVFLYVVYTFFLKRKTSFCTVVGGVPGALPPLVGYAAALNSWGDLSGVSWMLFYVMFFWQPPHFWALALMYKDDYKKTVFKMLPVTDSIDTTKKQILIYTIVMAVFVFMFTIEFVNQLFIQILLVLVALHYLRDTLLFVSKQGNKKSAKALFKTSVFFMGLFMVFLLIEFVPLSY
tara:strand:- start:750 stop:1694 length:945 start_codon:yes stop_codon:yes gene_type:complete